MQEVSRVFEVQGVAFHGALRCRDIGRGAYVVRDLHPSSGDVRQDWLSARSAFLEAAASWHQDEVEVCLCCGVRRKRGSSALPPARAWSCCAHGTVDPFEVARRYFRGHPYQEIVTFCCCGCVFRMVPVESCSLSHKAIRPGAVFTGLWIVGLEGGPVPCPSVITAGLAGGDVRRRHAARYLWCEDTATVCPVVPPSV